MNPRVLGGTLAAVVAICAPAIAYFEGMVPSTYADPVGIPTLCYGHTGPDVTPGRVATLDECQALLHGDIAEAYAGVQECIGVPMLAYQAAALTSFTFNVGRGNLCRSTLARKANYGDWIGACAELSKWTYAKGIQLPGLVKRRAAERAICEGKTPIYP